MAVVFVVVKSDLLSVLYIYFFMFSFILFFSIMKQDLDQKSSSRVSRHILRKSKHKKSIDKILTESVFLSFYPDGRVSSLLGLRPGVPGL